MIANSCIKQRGLTSEDVGLAPTSSEVQAGRHTPKYRDPKSGKTWTGNGKAPGWIAGAKNRDKFLIRAPAAAAQLEPAPAAAPIDVGAAAKKAGKKAMAASKSAAAKVVGTKTTKPVAVSVKKAAARKSTTRKAVELGDPVKHAHSYTAQGLAFCKHQVLLHQGCPQGTENFAR